MKHKRRPVVLLLAPGAVQLIIFTALVYYFMVETSFYKTNYVVKEFVGLRNYVESFRDPDYGKVFGNSFLYSAIICPSITFISLFFAMLVYDTPKWLQHSTKFIFYMPSFASGVIISQVWKWIYQPKIGLLNFLLGLAGIKPVVWMAQRYSAIFGISLMSIMGGLGLPLLLYLSNIQSISPEVFDAARIDGASANQIRWRIIFPMLIPTVLLVVIMNMCSGFYILESILMMTGGGRGTQNFMFNLFYEGTAKRAFGMASARSVLLFGLAIVMLTTMRWIAKNARR